MKRQNEQEIVVGRINLSHQKLSNLVEMLDEGVWMLKIIRADNGYRLLGRAGDTPYEHLIADSETDELKSHEELLWEVMDYFNFGGSKHDPERLRIEREKQK